MNDPSQFSPDDFPCGCLVITPERRILFANKYFSDVLDWDLDKLVGQNVEVLLSRASHIFCESYVFPILLQEGACLETQLTCRSPSGARVPVIANAQQLPDGKIVWSIFTSENRNRLHDELTAGHKTLQEQKKELLALSSMDALTGLMNRRAFDATMETAIMGANRTGHPLSILLLDIDDFKIINDTRGHQAGDDVLRGLGALLKQVSREHEVVARYGGEEFVFLLSGATMEDAYGLGKRIHAAVATLQADTFPVTVSIGISERSGRIGQTYAELLHEADLALYDAKKAGKNTTVLYAGQTTRQAVPI